MACLQVAVVVLALFAASNGFLLSFQPYKRPSCHYVASRESSLPMLKSAGSNTTSTTSEDEDLKFPVLFESARIFIVNKPPGISHHNEVEDTNNVTTTVMGMVNQTRQQYPQHRLWGVHRLDRVTSGILVFAKDAEMASHLTGAFSRGEIQKVYFGLSAKRAKKKQGLVQGGMVKSRDKAWKLVQPKKGTIKNSNDKQNYAKTRFYTGRWCSQYTCILFRPFTGKTHQLRVAAKAMGIALLGDPTYSDGLSNNDVDRTHLHASGIFIPSLDGHDSISLWSPPPFEESLQMEDTDDVVGTLMTKHCDVSSILEAMNSAGDAS